VAKNFLQEAFEMKRKTNKIRVGFTLVELLTTLAVIGVLLGLLIPALNMVSKTATKVKQKAQFHAIGTALETFRNDYGDYPPSEPPLMATIALPSGWPRRSSAAMALAFIQVRNFWAMEQTEQQRC
jgi:prepilin-type N-terminal cleavage/methylation domain-containing protein